MTLTPATFTWVCDLVRKESAIVLAAGKEYLVEARLLPIARATGHAGVTELVDAVRARPDRAVLQRIVEALTTNETSWFRDGDPFSALATTVLPSLLASRPTGEPLRIWSAASSSGQEPYTLAMILTDAMPGAASRVQITATDLSTEMVERTRAGKFSQLEVNRGLPGPMLTRHFTRVGNEWQVAQSLRAMVAPGQLNLAAPFPRIGPFDVVFLRNVLIYFDTATKHDILRKIRAVMKPDGWLFLGAAETTLGVDDTWERVVLGRSSAYRPSAGLGGGAVAAPVAGAAAAVRPSVALRSVPPAAPLAPRPAPSLPVRPAAAPARPAAAAGGSGLAASLASRAAARGPAAPASGSSSLAASLAARAAARGQAAPAAGTPAAATAAAAALAARIAAAKAGRGAAPPGAAAPRAGSVPTLAERIAAAKAGLPAPRTAAPPGSPPHPAPTPSVPPRKAF